MKYCPSCRYTEDEDEDGLINLHHVTDDVHHTANEHIPTDGFPPS